MSVCVVRNSAAHFTPDGASDQSPTPSYKHSTPTELVRTATRLWPRSGAENTTRTPSRIVISAPSAYRPVRLALRPLGNSSRATNRIRKRPRQRRTKLPAKPGFGNTAIP